MGARRPSGGYAGGAGARVEQAGVAWAVELTAETDRPLQVDAQETARAVTGMFIERAFDPDLAGGETDRQIRLQGRPFRDTARANPEVVCS